MSESATEEVLDELIDETIRGVLFDVHRAVKTGQLMEEKCSNRRGGSSGMSTEWNQYRVCSEAGKDVFGVSLEERRAQLFEVKCDVCRRVVVHSRFAPHMMKCMGHGRNSKRAASRRIAAQTEGHTSEEEEDEDSDIERPVRKTPRRAAAGSIRGRGASAAALRLPHSKSDATAVFLDDSDEAEEGWKELSTPSPSSLSTGSSTGSHKRLR